MSHGGAPAYAFLAMSRTAHPLASLLAMALLIPGLLAGLSVCGMPKCPAMATASDEHPCSQAGSRVLLAACCRVELETPATPLRTPERAESAAAAAQAVAVPALLPASVVTAACGSRTPRRASLDSLDQSCILRI